VPTLVDTRSVRGRVRTRLLERSDVDLERLAPPERRLRVRQEVLAVLREERAILPVETITDVVNQVSDEVVGLGPLERLLRDPEVSEVMVNGADDVFVERKGRIERVEGLVFEGEGQVFHLIERIVAPLGLRVDESMPYVGAHPPAGYARLSGPLTCRNAEVMVRRETGSDNEIAHPVPTLR
jgi:pilus assembly protein CpaF